MFNFGTNLKNIRLSRNITQKQLAELIGAAERAVQRYESNDSKPNYDMLIALAKHLNVSIDCLVGRIDIENSEIEIHLDEKKEKLLELFDALNDHNQGALLERASMLLEDQQKKETTKYKKSV